VVLKGAAVFAADLARRLTIPVQIEFVRAASYGAATQSAGNVAVDGDAALDIAGREVLLVEDIVDTGLTTRALLDRLHTLGPARLDLCALLHKPSRTVAPVAIRYKGFEIPDRFVVGYGMDYAERYRNLPNVCVLTEQA
jgi:hypoxanthine phosphoribosyltransferase